MKRIVPVSVLLTLLLTAVSDGVVADTWRPNYRIGPILFNQPLGDEVHAN